MGAALSDLWAYCYAIVQLTMRELKARDTRTRRLASSGVCWNPIGMMLVFTAVFTVFLPNNQIQNYPLFVLCGLLPWNFLRPA